MFCGTQAIHWEMQELGEKTASVNQNVQSDSEQERTDPSATGKYEATGTTYPILSEEISYEKKPLVDTAVFYPSYMTAATSWCTRDRQGRHLAPVDNLHASGLSELRAHHHQSVESGRSLPDP
jgi:hypothetical protein